MRCTKAWHWLILQKYQFEDTIFLYFSLRLYEYTLSVKRNFNFLEWCPLKIYLIKMNDFWINVSYSLHYPCKKKQRNLKCQKWDKCLQITTSPFFYWKSQKLLLSTAQTFGHFNSYSFKFNSGVRNHVYNRLLYRKPMITDPAIEFEWIAIEMSESLCGGKGAVCDFEIGLVIWRRFSFLALSISVFFGVGNEN